MTSSHFLSCNNSTTHINLSTPLIGRVANKSQSPYLFPEGTRLTKIQKSCRNGSASACYCGLSQTQAMFIEHNPAGTQLPGPSNCHHAASARLLWDWEKGKDPTLACFPRISFSRLFHWCQEGLHFTSYKLFQVGFVFFFSELSTPNVHFAT